MPEKAEHLIAIAGGRAFRVKLAQTTSLTAALEYVTKPGEGRGGFPDTALAGDWLETHEGFRVRRAAVDAYVIGHKQGEWAVAGPMD